MKEQQKELPGLEGIGRIPEIDALAVEYAEIRDQRIALLEQEVNLKTGFLSLMKAHAIDVYVHDSIEVRRVMEEETIKVKIRKPKEENPD